MHPIPVIKLTFMLKCFVVIRTVRQAILFKPAKKIYLDNYLGK